MKFLWLSVCVLLSIGLSNCYPGGDRTLLRKKRASDPSIDLISYLGGRYGNRYEDLNGGGHYYYPNINGGGHDYGYDDNHYPNYGNAGPDDYNYPNNGKVGEGDDYPSGENEESGNDYWWMEKPSTGNTNNDRDPPTGESASGIGLDEFFGDGKTTGDKQSNSSNSRTKPVHITNNENSVDFNDPNLV